MRRHYSVRGCTFGELGCGKTLTLVREAIRYREKLFPDLPIFSNIHLCNVKYIKVDSARILFELDSPCFLLLDELWHLADSRRSMSLINDIMSMLLLRSSKGGWCVWYSQQWYTQTDVRIRFITDDWVEPVMLSDAIVRLDVYDKHERLKRTEFYDGSLFWDDFVSESDPFTLNLDDLKVLYDRQCRKRGIRG